MQRLIPAFQEVMPGVANGRNGQMNEIDHCYATSRGIIDETCNFGGVFDYLLQFF